MRKRMAVLLIAVALVVNFSFVSSVEARPRIELVGDGSVFAPLPEPVAELTATETLSVFIMVSGDMSLPLP